MAKVKLNISLEERTKDVIVKLAKAKEVPISSLISMVFLDHELLEKMGYFKDNIK